MLSKITSTPKRVKNHIVKHRAKYASAVTAAGCYYAHKQVVEKWNDFLEEKGLLAEYYFSEE